VMFEFDRSDHRPSAVPGSDKSFANALTEIPYSVCRDRS
jgi:hypothetical protein